MNRCTSCGVPFSDHLGLIGTCAKLHDAETKLRKAMKLLRESTALHSDRRCDCSWCTDVREVVEFTNQPVMNGLRGALQHDMIKAHNESWVEGEGYDSTDWQNSLERRPE